MFDPGLEKLRQEGLFRSIRDRESAQGRKITIKGREYLNFASNDYLGLAGHPALIKAVETALKTFGWGPGASRLLGGGCTVHEELEKTLSAFKDTEAVLVFNSGYSANTGTIPAIASEDKGATETALLSDELNHASIIDGCRLSRAKTHVYRHRDMEHLESLLKVSLAKKKIVLTDTVFSMDGNIAPLKDIYSLCARYGALLYLDDAHGTGVLGRGRGALSHFGLKPEPWIIQMGTMSKALGSFGAFCAGGKDVIVWLQNSARSFMFSTALPAPAVAASLTALNIIKEDKTLLDKLQANRNKLITCLKGFNTGSTETPIIPLMMKDIEDALRLSESLYERGIYAPLIRPPTVKEPRIRLTVTAAHTDEDIERLTETLEDVKIKL